MTQPTAAPAPVRVLVVDADDRIRESLARLLPIGGRCLVVATAGQLDGALDLAESRGALSVSPMTTRTCSTGTFI